MMIDVSDYIVKDVYSFGRYPYISEKYIFKSYIKEIEEYNLPVEIIDVFKIAWNSRFWEKRGYDGATLVKDNREPRIDNFLHDYLYRMGYVGNAADVIYREMLIMTGYGKFKAYKRYIALMLASPVLYIKHAFKRNVLGIPEEVIKLKNLLKK
tara:strand:+ start:41949 stop:42407 length:459 start_codon:yes stop_codon:yes gene_type:complete